MAYTVIYEHGPNDEGRETWSAYVLELPGCVSGGETRAECEAMIREAIELHVDLLDLEAAIEKNAGKPLTDWDGAEE